MTLTDTVKSLWNRTRRNVTMAGAGVAMIAALGTSASADQISGWTRSLRADDCSQSEQVSGTIKYRYAGSVWTKQTRAAGVLFKE